MQTNESGLVWETDWGRDCVKIRVKLRRCACVNRSRIALVIGVKVGGNEQNDEGNSK